MKQNTKYKIFDDEASQIFADGKLCITEQNSGHTLIFDENIGYYTITDPYGLLIKKYKRFESAINFLMDYL